MIDAKTGILDDALDYEVSIDHHSPEDIDDARDPFEEAEPQNSVKRRRTAPKKFRTSNNDGEGPVSRGVLDEGHARRDGDACSTFCDYLASKLREFDAISRAEVVHKINNIIYETELKMLQ